MSLITTAFLNCGQCTNSFPINLNIKPETIICPFCQTVMTSDMIQEVYRTALTVADLNYHFKKYADERNEPSFSLTVAPREVSLPIDNIL